MRRIDRREFFHDTGRLAAALSAAGLLGPRLTAAEETKPAKKGDVQDRLRVAVIGVRSRGMDHLGKAKGGGYLDSHNNTVVTTICDCDEAVIGKAMTAVEKAQGKAPKYEKDLRKVLDNKDVDVISIAMPNHWHSLAAIWAMQAGKDVYVEKPVSHNVSEGRRVVEAARKYNKICETGTQIRSSPGIREAMEYLHSGQLGKVHLSRGLCYKRRESIGKVSGPQKPPATMDYDLWCGPAPNNPPTRNGKFGPVHYDWHWVWDYGNGDLGNQGIHQMDVARWGLNKSTLPNAVVSLGGRYGYVDDGQTPNTLACAFDYGDCELIFEVRGLPTEDLLADVRGKETADKRMKATVGNVFYGDKGYVIVSNYNDAVALDYDDKVLKTFGGEADHFANFTKAVRSRNAGELHADILEGHLSSALCHLGNISYRLGREVPFDSQEVKALADDKDAAETVARMKKHLAANDVSSDKAVCRMGLKLTIDPKAERFTNNKDANAMLTRAYRKGFEVPEKI